MLCIEEVLCLAQALLYKIENDQTLTDFEKMEMNGLLDKICRKNRLSIEDVRLFSVHKNYIGGLIG